MPSSLPNDAISSHMSSAQHDHPRPAPGKGLLFRRDQNTSPSLSNDGSRRPPDRPLGDQPRRSREQGTASKRGRYVSKACVNCQKRKVKCTGEEACQQCRAADLPCSYNVSKKRRKVPESKGERPDDFALRDEMANGVVSQSGSIDQMLRRISDLERDCSFFRTQLQRSPEPELSSPSRSLVRHSASDTDEEIEPPVDRTFQGPTSIMNPIGVLSNTVAGSDGSPSRSSRTDDPMPQSALNWCEISRSDAHMMEAAERDSDFQDTARQGPLIARFFEQINPYYPSLNENEFRGQLAELVAPTTEPRLLNKPDRYQLVALANLMMAEVRLLSDEWIETEAVPGWAHFWRAEGILRRLVWQGNGNRLTVQCLIVKARYLMYLEHGSAAHETICRAVRLCFQLGLHDKSSWTACSPFECVMRERIFWTVFYLERSVALNCGYPYLIRETDIQVGIPAAYDDQALFPDKPLPLELAETRSYAPNLAASIKWSRLTAEIWDAMFAANHAPIDPEFVTSMDARILYTMNHLPPFFRTSVPISADGVPGQSPFIWYQGQMQQLRHQQLRLLLRQESLLTLDYDEATAVECQEIILNTLQMLRGPPHVGDVPVGRLAVVFYIIVTLLPLICLINGRRATQARPDAISCFRTEVEMLQQLAPSVGMARHVLSHMHDLIAATKDVIKASHVSSTDMYPFNPYGKSMERSAYVPPDFLQTQGESMTALNELIDDPCLLDVLVLPSNDSTGLWSGDGFGEPWMQMAS